MYQPLSEDQYNNAVKAGFTPARIVQMESQRKAQDLAQQPQPGFFSKNFPGIVQAGQDIKGAFNSGVQQVKDAYHAPSTNPITGVENLLKMGSGAATAITSPLAPALKPIQQDVINPIGDKIGSNPTIQKFANSKAGEVTSRVAEDVGNAANVAGTVLGGKELFESGKNFVNNAAENIKTSATNQAADVAAQAQKTLETNAVKDATPAYNKKLIKDQPIRNANGTTTPRVTEAKGLTGQRTVTSTQLETEAGQALTKVKDYPTKGTNLEKYQSIQPEIARQGQGLEASLKNEKILRPPQQILKIANDAMDKALNDSLILQKADPVVTNYSRVIKNAISQSDGTLAGEFKVRQIMDTAYKNARGKLAYGSDKISALDEVHTAVRDALNQDVINKARNTDVQAALKSEWDLYRASKVLREKAEAEAGSTLEQFAQNHPIITKGVKAVGRLGGLGEVVKHAP